MMPPGLPVLNTLVAVSGGAEIVGGIGLLVRLLRRAAGVWLIVVPVAVFPANAEMLQPYRSRGVSLPAELLW